jgi:hypothetical protein
VDKTSVSWLVINAIADDYEDVGTILADISPWALKKRIAFDRDKVIEALISLVRSGLASAYAIPTVGPPIKIKVADRSDIGDDTYFVTTQAGRSVVLSSDTL